MVLAVHILHAPHECVCVLGGGGGGVLKISYQEFVHKFKDYCRNRVYMQMVTENDVWAVGCSY